MNALSSGGRNPSSPRRAGGHRQALDRDERSQVGTVLVLVGLMVNKADVKVTIGHQKLNN